MLTVLSYHVVLPMSVMRGDDAIATVFGETIGKVSNYSNHSNHGNQSIQGLAKLSL